MGHGGSVLTAERMAAAVAPVIDRLRVAISRAVPTRAASLAMQYGLQPPEAALLSMLRNAMPQRLLSRADVAACFVYAPPHDTTRSLDALAAAGVIEWVAADSLRLTEAGRTFVVGLREQIASFVDELWAEQSAVVDALIPLAGRVVEAARDTGGPAFSVMAPVYEPAGTSPAMVLAERLTPMRFHRFDAHVAAWTAAGLTAGEVRALTDSGRRQAIEAETNQRSARAYECLSEDERLTLLSGLGALPN